MPLWATALTPKRLPLATLFQSPTVEQLARQLQEEGEAPLWSSLVPIQPDGFRSPLFCMHPQTVYDGG